MAKIAVDIGHGSNTFPPSKGVYRAGKGYAEHDFNAKVALEIKRLLEKQGHTVILGQQPNRPDVHLRARTNLYNREKVDLVVSAHANWNSNSNVNGRCIFYWHSSSASKRLAINVRDEIKKLGYSTHGNGLHESMRGSWTNLHIVRETRMPAILVEYGFMSGNKDFELVFGSKQGKYITDMANATVRGIQGYLGQSFKGSVSSSSARKAGWVENKTGWWYRKSDGSYPKSGWGKINDRWYLFDDRGYMLTGWQKVKGTWYYMNKSGRMQTGWIKLNKKWYYLHTNGAMRTGWLWLNENWYYLNSSGEMQVYWFQTSTDGPWFYSNGSGRMQTGWVKSGGRWFYLHSNGHMATGLLSIGGQVYYLQRDGALITEDIVKLEANKSGHLK